jgi:signal transduction histidine kinase
VEPLRTQAGRDTVRTFVLFGVLLAGIVAVSVEVVYRDMERVTKVQRILIGRQEAGRIADFVGEIGREPGGLDYSRVRRNLPAIETEVRRRLSESDLMERVEVRDRFGAPLLAVSRHDPDGPATPGGLHHVTVRLRRGTNPVGQILVSISEAGLQRDVDRLWRSFRLKLALSASVAVGILVVAFFYVLHLLRKNRALEQSKLSAERAAYRGVLASGLAHEIRNPLNAMNMNLQMLEEELQAVPALGQEDWSDLLNSTKSEIKRLERLVNNFLQYARPPRPKFEPRDLNALAKEIALFLQADFRGHGVEIRVELEPLLPSVDVDDSQLKQALMNILVNGRQVMKDGGVLVLRTGAGSGGEVLLEVQDEGPGIAPEVAEKIFEPFYSTRGGGTGLGLPIARQIVESHGGRIEVVRRPEKGTIFRILLPRRHERASDASGRAS